MKLRTTTPEINMSITIMKKLIIIMFIIIMFTITIMIIITFTEEADQLVQR